MHKVYALLCTLLMSTTAFAVDPEPFQQLSACGALPKVKTFQRTHFLRDRERRVTKAYLLG
jgi:hypothetical protein